MPKIVCFGEIMLRLNPKNYLRFVQANEFEASYAGGEANVAASLAGYGMDAFFVSKVPAHEIGQCAVNELRRFGVDTSEIRRGGDRLGIYFLEKGASQRASKVIYDRADSAIALANPGEFDWDSILNNADWFHFTGITPALGANACAITLDALRTARKKKVPVSCDLNYRKKLWSREEAGKTMASLMEYVQLCIANEEDAADVFGIRAEGTDVRKGELSRDGYVSVAKQLTDRFGFEKTAITLRGSVSASENFWSGLLYDRGEAFFGPDYRIQLVDRVGGGDAFGGGLISAQLNNFDSQHGIDFAVAASALAQSISGDYNLMRVDEVEALVKGDGSGRVQR